MPVPQLYMLHFTYYMAQVIAHVTCQEFLTNHTSHQKVLGTEHSNLSRNSSNSSTDLKSLSTVASEGALSSDIHAILLTLLSY